MEIDYKTVHVDKTYRYISAPDWKATTPIVDYNTWCEANLLYVVPTTKKLHLRPDTNLVVCNWIRDVCKGYWTRSVIDVGLIHYRFELRNDAIMFKLKWG